MRLDQNTRAELAPRGVGTPENRAFPGRGGACRPVTTNPNSTAETSPLTHDPAAVAHRQGDDSGGAGALLVSKWRPPQGATRPAAFVEASHVAPVPPVRPAAAPWLRSRASSQRVFGSSAKGA